MRFSNLYRFFFGCQATPPPIPPPPPGKREPKSLIQQVIHFRKTGLSTINKDYDGKYGKGWMMGCSFYCILLVEKAPMDWIPMILPDEDLCMNGIYCRLEPKEFYSNHSDFSPSFSSSPGRDAMRAIEQQLKNYI